MRWFKHMTASSNDEFIVWVEEEYGLAGYARWFKLIELVAAQTTKSQRMVVYPIPQWCSFLKAKRKLALSFLLALSNRNKIIMELNGNILGIEICNLMKFHDEYTRKSGHTTDKSPDTIRTKNIEEEVEADNYKKDGASPPRAMNLFSLSDQIGVPRAVLGRQIKISGQSKCAAVLGQMLAEEVADPVPYFISATAKKKNRLAV